MDSSFLKQRTKRKTEIKTLRDRLGSTEKSLRKLDEAYSYKLEVAVWPEWDKIFGKLSGSNDWWNQLGEDEKKELRARASESISWKEFYFVEFYDSLNGLQMLWSDHRKTFVDDYEIHGSILPDNTLTAKNLMDAMGIIDADGGACSERRLPLSCVSASGISFSRHYNKKVEATYIDFPNTPFRQIKELLIEIAKIDRLSPMRGIKRFPNNLQERLDEQKVTYRPDPPWDDEGGYRADYFGDVYEYDGEKALPDGLVLFMEQAGHHVFETEYYKLRLCISVPDRMRINNV